MEKRTSLVRQPSLYVGLVLGIVVAILIGLLATLILSSVNAQSKPGISNPRAGNVTISLSQSAVNLAIQLAVKQVQPQLPFTITGASTVLRAGDEIDVYATGQPVFGITPNALVSLSPAVGAGGTLDFRVEQVTFTGLNLSLGDTVNQAIEAAINQQFAGYGRGNLIHGLHYQLVEVSTTPTALILTAKLTTS